MGHVLCHRAAGRLAQPDAVAAIARRRRRAMGVAVTDMAVVPALQLVVRGKAAAGQHDAAPGSDLLSFALALHDRAGNCTIALQEFHDRAVEPQPDAALFGREGEGRDQTVAVGQSRTTIVVQPVDHVACRHAGDMER